MQLKNANGRVRILVVGQDGCGKSTLVEALCGDPWTPLTDTVSVGLHVSVRQSGFSESTVEEYYDLAGAPRFARARKLLLRRPYDALILVHDLTDPVSRTQLRRTWTPLAMLTLGDANALSAGGRPNGARHVRARGAWNELILLWRHVRSAYSRVSKIQAARDAVWLLMQIFVLVIHEIGLWTDERIDRAAERELLDGSTVPVCVVGMKADLLVGDIEEDPIDEERSFARGGRDLFVVHTSRTHVEMDEKFTRFLKRAAEFAKEGEFAPAHKRAGSLNATVAQSVLPF